MRNKAVLFGMLAITAQSALLAQDIDPVFSGTIRSQWESRLGALTGPLAAANTMQNGIAPIQPNAATLEAELHASGQHWRLIGTAQQQYQSGPDAGRNSASWVNEAVLSHDVGGWQWSVGKKMVAWDVGYAFRPNDVVQQEARRTLVSTLPQGRPLVMADYISDDAAWTLVAVNPTAQRSDTGGQEPALAMRYYQQAGNVDWHGFARIADRTGASAGGAVAWVASDSLELHASARWMERADSKALVLPASVVAGTSPWQPSSVERVTQVVVGGTWTNAAQLSVLAEAWWDGTALSPAQWTQWRQRSQSLQALSGQGVPLAALAGNLAWQADALSASNSLQQSNVYMRVSWDYENWQPSLDVLAHPDDGGYMWTAALLWKGDRIKAQLGTRMQGGPADSVLAQLPAQRQSYLVLSCSF